MTAIVVKRHSAAKDAMALFYAIVLFLVVALFGAHYSVSAERSDPTQELIELRQAYSVASTAANKAYLRNRILDAVRPNDVKTMPADLQAFYMFIELSEPNKRNS